MVISLSSPNWRRFCAVELNINMRALYIFISQFLLGNQGLGASLASISCCLRRSVGAIELLSWVGVDFEREKNT
ncbi:hypothetical protein M0R45_030421 [Rubus argutus]|uniref:Uncharacterized protein n=1 Tax=Rubus argutus TaxID=59490 RepID=A0AAW1WEN6_RUBAR